MFEIILVVCLTDQPKICKDVAVQYVEAVPPDRCMLSAQLEAAKWLEQHPKWGLKSWTCQPAGRTAKA